MRRPVNQTGKAGNQLEKKKGRRQGISRNRQKAPQTGSIEEEDVRS